MAGSTFKGESVPCQGGGCAHFPREGVRARVNMREGSMEERSGPYPDHRHLRPSWQECIQPQWEERDRRKEEEETSRHKEGK